MIEFKQKSRHSALFAGCSGTAFVALFACIATPAFAQSAAQAAGQDEASQGDIIVTAQRRAQSVQDVPIAITVVSGDALKVNNFTSLTDVQYLAPSVKFREIPGQSSFSIRGVGSEVYDLGVEASVGIALDDVVQTLPGAPALNMFADVQRVEVLRGPQGTLFGKNTSAGLISIVTRRPVLGERSVEAHLQYGSRNDLQTYGIVNLPIASNAALRLRGGYHIQDNFIRNLGPARIPGIQDYALNAKLLWNPTETLSLYVIGDLQRSSGSAGLITVRSLSAPNTAVAQAVAAAGITPGPNNRDITWDGDPSRRATTKSIQLNATLELGSHTLNSVSAYKQLYSNANPNTDSVPTPLLDTNRTINRGKQYSQELRLSSPTGGLVEYTVGAFYFHSKVNSENQQYGTFGLPAGLLRGSFVSNNGGGQLNQQISVDSYAAFGELTVHPTENVRLFAGTRYTHDKINAQLNISEITGVCGFEILQGVCHAGPLPTAPVSGKTSHGDYTARGGIEFDVAPDVMLYGTVSRGYKGAGFTRLGTSQIEIRPETVVSEEIGMKSRFFDRRVTLNIAAFHSQFKDFQAQVVIPAAPPSTVGQIITGNAPGLKSQGVEADLSVRPVTGLILSGNIGYVDARFTKYMPACYAGQTAAQGCSTVVNGVAVFDASKFPLNNSPKWTYSLAGSYEHAIGDKLKASTNVNYSYRSSAYTAIGNTNTIVDPYGIINASISLGAVDDSVKVQFFVQNLANKHFPVAIIGTPLGDGIRRAVANGVITNVGSTGYSNILTDRSYRRFGMSIDFRL